MIKKFIEWIRSFFKKDDNVIQEAPVIVDEEEKQLFIMNFSCCNEPDVESYIKIYQLMLDPKYCEITQKVVIQKLGSFFSFRDEEVIFLDYMLSRESQFSEQCLV